ncbi:MAG: hypothetical protein LKE59_07840 [Eubacterium sp.]|nr:hypothetical protein [Eubacterium sp.]MCH4080401.1 hypothetical protein [Eubacterium sp.]MCH4110649.1 hypothetical protein [Eubacterium sp.]MCI1405786.1 hypothetical protein [Eubacterium sp.]
MERNQSAADRISTNTGRVLERFSRSDAEAEHIRETAGTAANVDETGAAVLSPFLSSDSDCVCDLPKCSISGHHRNAVCYLLSFCLCIF